MQKLRINGEIYREAKTIAARNGMTLSQFIEEAVKERIDRMQNGSSFTDADHHQRMETLLLSTAHFRIGPKPTREEMYER